MNFLAENVSLTLRFLSNTAGSQSRAEMAPYRLQFWGLWRPVHAGGGCGCGGAWIDECSGRSGDIACMRRRNTCRNHVEWSENTPLFFANGKTWRTCAGPIVESHFSTVSKYLMDTPSPLFWCVWVVVNNLPIVKAGVIPGPKYPRQGASEQVSRETYASCSGGASTSGTAAQPMPSSSQRVYSQTRTCPH